MIEMIWSLEWGRLINFDGVHDVIMILQSYFLSIYFVFSKSSLVRLPVMTLYPHPEMVLLPSICADEETDSGERSDLRLFIHLFA